MQELPPASLAAGIVTVLAVVLLRARAGRARPPVWVLALAGIGGAFGVPAVLALLAAAGRAVPGLPDLSVNDDRLFIGGWVALLALALSIRPGQPPRLPLWGVAALGVAAAVVVPAVLDRATGQFQPASLRADMTHCLAARAGAVVTAVNRCAEPVVVGLCLPGEVNPAPCAQSLELAPGAVARLDTGGAARSSLPSAPDGYTLVACHPGDRPSRMRQAGGRGHEGVCLPPG